MEDEFEDRRVQHWHMSKSVTIGTILTVFVLIVAQVFAYGASQEKLKGLEKRVIVSAKETIHKSTVVQMFANKDIQIKAISNDLTNVKENVKEVKQGIKENQRMLIQILKDMPRSKE